MRELIDRAVAHVRMTGEPSVERVPIQLFRVVSEVESSFLPEANAKSISLFVDADPVLEVSADRHLIISALANLVKNALKYTPTGGTVWVRALAEGEHAVIEVEDRCGGIPDGKMERLFEPFVQENLDKTGLGLGLTIASRATQLNGGTLSARNVPGVGCVFTMRMAACRHGAAASV